MKRQLPSMDSKPARNKTAAMGHAHDATSDAVSGQPSDPIAHSAFLREIRPSTIAEVERERAAVKQAVSNTLEKYQRRMP